MSSGRYCRWQCSFCSAYFQTESSLQGHLEEYRLRAVELERCKAHADANRSEPPEEALFHEHESLGSIKSNTKCPHPGCDQTKLFAKGQQLRVHFRTHVTCEEVCVCCFKVFRLVSEYIRHTRIHVNASATKSKYMAKLGSELRKLADDELSRCLPTASKVISKKRRRSNSVPRREASDEATQSEYGAASKSRFLQDCSTEVSHPAASDPVKKQQVYQAASPANIEPSYLPLDIHSESFQPVVNDAEYDAPLFRRLNFPEWVPDPSWLLGMAEVATTAIPGDK